LKYLRYVGNLTGKIPVTLPVLPIILLMFGKLGLYGIQKNDQ